MNSTNDTFVQEISKYVRIPADDVFLLADLQVPVDSTSVVLCAHDCGRSRDHPRIRHVARVFRDKGVGTLLCDLITEDEEKDDEATGRYRNNAELLAKRLIAVTKWVIDNPDTKDLRIGYYGACSGGAAVLMAAAKMQDEVGAIVTRDGSLDLASKSLSQVTSPTLLIIGGNDPEGIKMHRKALHHLKCEKELRVIPGASHLFVELGTLEAMATISAEWYRHHLKDVVSHV